MLRRRLYIAARSILLGWATILALGYLVERPLLIWTAPLVGAHWVATVKLSLDCLALAATGWIIGRLHRDAPLLGTVAFAVTLALFNLDPLLDTNVVLLIRVLAAAFGDLRNLDSLGTALVQYCLLFGCLIAGGLLSRPSARPLSLFREHLR